MISRWFFFTRLVGTISVIACNLLLGILNVINFNYKLVAFGLLPLYFILSLIWFLLSRVKKWNGRFLYFQLFIDLITITVGIYLSGSTHSEFVYLYLMVVLAAAIVSMRAVITTSLSALIFYLSLVALEQLRIIPQAAGSYYGIHGNDVIHVAVYSMIALIVTFQGYFYVSRIRKKNEEIMKLKNEFFFHTVHDLRSPETVIRWILEKYNDPEFIKKYPEFKEDLAIVTELNKKIRKMIDDIVIIIKGEELVSKKETVDIAKVVNDMALKLKAAMEKKKIIFRI